MLDNPTSAETILSPPPVAETMKTHATVTRGSLKPKLPWSAQSSNEVVSFSVLSCYTQAIKVLHWR